MSFIVELELTLGSKNIIRFGQDYGKSHTKMLCTNDLYIDPN